MFPYFKQSTGSVSLITVFVISLAVVSVIGIAAVKTTQKNELKTETTPVTASPTLLPTPSPTPTPTPSPTPLPKPSLAPKPAAPALPTITTPPTSGYGRIAVNTDRGSFTAHIVTLDASAQMVTDTANDDDCADSCPTIPLSDFVSRNGGYAGINGTYFCPASYPECASKKDSFDFPVYNSRLKKWINDSKRSWNGRSIVYKDGSGIRYMQNSNEFGGGLDAGIINYPGILNNGHITVEAPSLSEKQSAKGTKGGIGYGNGKIYLVIAQGVDMYDFASVFKAIGATHALNLDGGGSAALYYNGYKVGPGRNLPNAIIFK